MRVALASDLHLEFGSIELKNTGNADVLILSGDILIADDLYRFMEKTAQLQVTSKRQQAAESYRKFLRQVSTEFKHVLYIAGNHEFYHGKFFQSLNVLKEEAAKCNVKFLENDSVEIDGVTFVGATLWTDMNKGDPITLSDVATYMNDYRSITYDKDGFANLRPSHVIERFKQSFSYVKKAIKGKSEVVVLTHHAPTKLSVKPGYENEYYINGAYSSDLSEFILDHPQIKLWTHGHTHSQFDYMMGSTRICCNPRGYIGYEEIASNFDLMYIDV